MIANREPESLFLDYKRGDKGDFKEKKAEFSRALSGYANTDGGILIWGVNCKRTEFPGLDYKLDVPTDEPALAPNVKQLEDQFKAIVSTATVDFVERVQVVSVPFNGGPSGCIICYILGGRNKPYRAEFSGKAYYVRLPDRFEVMPHGLLRTMLFPEYSPVMALDVSAYLNYTGGMDTVFFEIDLANEGNATADDVMVRTECDHDLFAADNVKPSFEATYSRKIYSRTKVYEFYGSRPIHPGSTIGLCKLNTAQYPHITLSTRPVRLQLEIFVRNGRARKFVAEFFPMTLVERVTKRAVAVEPDELAGQAQPNGLATLGH